MINVFVELVKSCAMICEDNLIGHVVLFLFTLPEVDRRINTIAKLNHPCCA